MNEAIWNLMNGSDDVMNEDVSIKLNEAATRRALEERTLGLEMEPAAPTPQVPGADSIWILES